MEYDNMATTPNIFGALLALPGMAPKPMNSSIATPAPTMPTPAAVAPPQPPVSDIYGAITGAQQPGGYDKYLEQFNAILNAPKAVQYAPFTPTKPYTAPANTGLGGWLGGFSQMLQPQVDLASTNSLARFF